MTAPGMFHVHRSERADGLVAPLAALLATPPGDPFAPDVVAVPGGGVARWLAQRLSHHLGAGVAADGVCAGVGFPSPTALTDRVLSGPGGHEADAWAPERLVWPLIEVIDACAGEPWCAALDAYVTGRPGRRVAAARHLAGLFAAYGEHRPAMVRAWAQGGGTDASAGPSGSPGAVPADLSWQTELWRRLRARVGVPAPAETLPERCARLRADPAIVDLPDRVSVFGPLRLPAGRWEVLCALAAHRDVHLWLPHPSPASWERADGPDVTNGTNGTEVTNGTGGGHPLLASLGREQRELATRLRALDVAVTDHHHPGPALPRTRLGGLQDDLRHDRAPVARTLDPSDTSVTVHACHGPDRQVEVLREAVLGLLARDETLEPRDVLVLCADLETYAPLITAALGSGADGEHPGHRLPVRLADRSLRQANPLLGLAARLLELADARLTASELLGLAESAPVRRRFGFDDDDVDALRALVAAAGVRWGLDAEHRRPFGLAAYPQNSWAAGLDRLLLGVAMSGDDHRWLGTALPLDEVDSDLVDLVGRLAELVDRVAVVLDRLTGTHPLAHWTGVLVDALDALAAVTPAESWQVTQARAELTELAEPDDARAVALGLADVRGMLDERLRGRPARANFRTGAITVAGLAPMRAVPHRVICLLGLDDGVFPREGVEDGDDVLRRAPRAGEDDARVQDRALLLDAVCAATDHLVVVHSGADERTGAPRPPAVPLGELLDAVGADAVVTHPLQPFDPRNFDARSPFSFDADALAGARRLAARADATPRAERAFLDGPLAPRADPATALEDLVRFVEHPVKAFLAQRLGLYPRGDDAEPDDALPVEIDALTEWSVGDRLLTDRLAGASAEACRQAEWRRGVLPPGALGHRLLERIGASVEPLVELAVGLQTDAARALDVDLVLAAHRLTGTVGGLRGATLLTVTYSKLAAKHRLRAWVHLLALTAQTGHELRATTIGRGFRGPARSVLGPVAPERARALLADLVELRAEGLREPLPLPARTSAAYAEHRARGGDDEAARAQASKTWGWGDDRDASHLRVWGPIAFEALPPERFAALAERVWRPLISAERKDTPG